MPASFVHWLEYSAGVAFVAALVAVLIGWFFGSALAKSESARPAGPWFQPLLAGIVVFGLSLLLLAAASDIISFSVGLGLAFVVGALPFSIWQAKRSLRTIPQELIEAARLEGCSSGQIRRLVTLPLTRAAFAVATLFCLLTAWSLFAIVPAITESTSKLGFSDTSLTLGPKEMLLVSIPLVVLFLLFAFFSRRIRLA
jgi:ABC-type glycerol-3-phosphate transport system permease component